jgi:hypothetical protein
MEISYKDAMTLLKEHCKKNGLKPSPGKLVAQNALRTHLQVELPVDTAEEPILTNHVDELAKLCGLR